MIDCVDGNARALASGIENVQVENTQKSTLRNVFGDEESKVIVKAGHVRGATFVDQAHRVQLRC